MTLRPDTPHAGATAAGPTRTGNAGRVRRLLGPGLLTLAMLAVLVGLGTWQVERMHWKNGIVAQIARAEASPPVPLIGNPSPFAKVQVTGQLRDDLSAFYGAEVRDTRTGPQMGSYLVQPLIRPDGRPILIERGWVPSERVDPIAQPLGTVTVTGFVHPAEQPGWFSASDDAATRTFYTLDPAAIGDALGLPRVAPFVLVALGPQPPQHWPDPAKHLPRPPNNHLQYAITWYGLAASLLVIFVIWSRKVLRA